MAQIAVPIITSLAAPLITKLLGGKNYYTFQPLGAIGDLTSLRVKPVMGRGVVGAGRRYYNSAALRGAGRRYYNSAALRGAGRKYYNSAALRGAGPYLVY